MPAPAPMFPHVHVTISNKTPEDAIKAVTERLRQVDGVNTFTLRVIRRDAREDISTLAKWVSVR